MKGRTVLLTGGTGFLGSHLAEALVREGSRLRCLVRPSSSYGPLQRAGVELAFGRLEDAASLRRAVGGCDVVFHVAGATKVTRVEEYTRINVEGTRRLIEAAAAAASSATVLYVSSLAACGPSRAGVLLAEDDPLRPVSAYGRSKRDGEEAVRASGLKWVIARPPAVYGPRDRDVLSLFKLAARRLAPRPGRHERTVSLIHVKDLCAGLIQAAEARAGSTYFLSDPRPYAWNEVTDTIAAAVGRRVVRFPVPMFLVWSAALVSGGYGRLTGRPVIFNRDKVRELTFTHWACSSAKAARELGFQPAHDLKRRVEETAAWYRKEGWL